MITQMPERLRLALGNDVSRDLEGWLEGILVADYVQHTEWEESRDRLGRVEMRLTAVETRLDGVEMRLTAVETRLDGVEMRLTAVETRLSIVEIQLAELKAEFHEFRREVTERFDRQSSELLAFSNSVNERLDRQYQQMLVQTRWNVGLIGLFGTIFAILYGIGQLKP